MKICPMISPKTMCFKKDCMLYHYDSDQCMLSGGFWNFVSLEEIKNVLKSIDNSINRLRVTK